MLPSVTEEIKMSAESYYVRNDDATILAEIKGIPITVLTFKRISNGQWINDEIVSVFVKLLLSLAKRNSMYVWDHFFMDRLLLDKNITTDNWASRRVREIENMTKVDDTNIKEMDTFLFPINYKNSHWLLAIADTKSKELVIFDSI